MNFKDIQQVIFQAKFFENSMGGGGYSVFESAGSLSLKLNQPPCYGQIFMKLCKDDLLLNIFKSMKAIKFSISTFKLIKDMTDLLHLQGQPEPLHLRTRL